MRLKIIEASLRICTRVSLIVFCNIPSLVGLECLVKAVLDIEGFVCLSQLEHLG